MLRCSFCDEHHGTGNEHIKHLVECHPSKYREYLYRCQTCSKSLKWNGYRLHSHVLSYDQSSTTMVQSIDDGKNDVDFGRVVQRCFDKWNEMKGRPNATTAAADDIFNFGKEIASLMCEEFVKRYDPKHFERYQETLSQSFNDVSSAYKRKKAVSESPSYVRPTPYTINKRFETRRSRNDVVLKQSDNDIAYIHPRRSLETLLQKETVIQTLYMPSHFNASSTVDHVFSSQRCKTLFQEIGKDFIAVQLYADDFGTTNPLGHSSTTCKMNAFYMRVLNLPAALLSQEEFVILLSLGYTDDVKNRFQSLINRTIVPDFQELFDNGIDLVINGVVQNFPVVIFNVIGDNLGVHQLFGYLQSFNTLNPCRMCKVTNITLKTITSLTKCVLKTEAEYDALVINGNYDRMKQNGIREKSSFNNLSYFHILRCQCLDLMHDVLEGCGKYVMLNVLKTLKLDELNDAWRFFPFKKGDKTNASMTFTDGQLKQEQLTGLTSSMMLTLIRFLPLVVLESNIAINTRTPWWSIFMDFVQILDILMAQSFTQEKLDDLQHRIEAYLKRYQAAGGHMTVKSHFFLHDPDVIREMGPLRWNWCMRYEAAHRSFKQYAVINRNHQNVAVTYAEKHQHSKMNFFTALDDPEYLQKRMLQRDIERYSPGTFVALRVDETVPVFGCIKSYKKDADMFKVVVYKTLLFDKRRHCYVVESSEEEITVPSWSFVIPEVMELYSDKYLRLPYSIV